MTVVVCLGSNHCGHSSKVAVVDSTVAWTIGHLVLYPMSTRYKKKHYIVYIKFKFIFTFTFIFILFLYLKNIK